MSVWNPGRAANDVILERARQVEEEGWTPEHDDTRPDGELAKAGSAYAYAAGYASSRRPPWWPWSQEWWKPTGDRRALVKAAALIIAEIEKIDRKEAW